MPKSHFPEARKDALVIKELPDETLVYDLRANKAYCLNQSAAMVWKSCDGKNQPALIAKHLEKKLKTTVPEDLVWLALDQLTKDNLLVEQPSTPKLAYGKSRRDIIRRIGLATVIALPAVTSLIVPNAATAQSCVCNSPGDCLTQTSCPNTANCNLSKVCAP